MDKCVNPIAASMNTGMKTMFTIIRDLMKKGEKRRPEKPIPIKTMDALGSPEKSAVKAIWFGHSTVLLEMEGKRLFLDPTFSDSPSPFPFVGGKRFSKVLPIELEQLLPIDMVLLSHDHYDHLDYGTIMQIKEKVGLFCVPSGVGNRLKQWGIDQGKIKEFAWWEEAGCDGLAVACTPARHFSGRSMFDRNKTLWCSWAILGQSGKVFFSGDGGYGPHFNQIGKKYGPFDLTMMECGQYDERWAGIHMLPEQTVQAHLDIAGRLLLPIHWAAFSLAFHSWTDPVERALKAAKERQVRMTTPMIGETVLADADDYPGTRWWR